MSPLLYEQCERLDQQVVIGILEQFTNATGARPTVERKARVGRGVTSFIDMMSRTASNGACKMMMTSPFVMRMTIGTQPELAIEKITEIRGNRPLLCWGCAR